GLLRLAVARAVVPLVVQPLLASFRTAYPDVRVEISASEEVVDLAGDGFDAAIRLGELIEADMVTVRLTPPYRNIVVGNPEYFARCGRPRTFAGLASHDCVRLRRATTGALAPWRVKEGDSIAEVEVSGSLIVNDVPTMLSAA